MLRRGEAMVFAVLRAMVAKDLGHLQGWSGHGAAVASCSFPIVFLLLEFREKTTRNYEGI